MLSKTAQAHRRRDMSKFENDVSATQYLYIIALGVWILARSRMSKATPKKKAAYLSAAILATTILIHLFTVNGQMGWALVIMFLLGVIFAEFRHLN